ncbi:hypothetical protein [Bacillus cereus]|uniref:hypothetical protein n=1 Tax=Bacillus cereus TaxID=1396 RepID=UPI000BFE4F1E|nr:hypothetical protein [Bacillus cereus]PGK39834.1 hypothetical protein CN909_24385 [Bacillus cereus]
MDNKNITFNSIALPSLYTLNNLYICKCLDIENEDHIFIFQAKNRNDFLEKLFMKYKKDYIQWLSDRNINFSFAEQFFYYEDKYLFCNVLSPDLSFYNTREIFIIFFKNVYDFFDNPKHSKQYIEYFISGTSMSFDLEFIKYCFFNDSTYLKFEVIEILTLNT